MWWCSALASVISSGGVAGREGDGAGHWLSFLLSRCLVYVERNLHPRVGRSVCNNVTTNGNGFIGLRKRDDEFVGVVGERC